MCILLIRDPFTRDILKESCLRASSALANAMLTLIRRGGASLFRNALRTLRMHRNRRNADEWCIVPRPPTS